VGSTWEMVMDHARNYKEKLKNGQQNAKIVARRFAS
jgi:hypothetical protein